MSNYCQACGGLLGRDCFNEQECMQISQSNYDHSRIDQLEQEIIILREALTFYAERQHIGKDCHHYPTVKDDGGLARRVLFGDDIKQSPK